MRSLPLLLVFLASLAQAADYPLDAPAPDGRRPGGTISQELPAPWPRMGCAASFGFALSAASARGKPWRASSGEMRL